MNFTAAQIAQWLGGIVEGNAAISVGRLNKIEEAEQGDISFLANPKYIPFVYTTKASILLVGLDFLPETPISPTLIRVADVYAAFAQLLEAYNTAISKKTGIEQPSFIAPTAQIGENVYIGAFAYIGHNAVLENGVQIYPNTYIGDSVRVGNDTVIYSGAKIYHQCSIGRQCIIHAGAVIGSDGFGFAPQPDGSYKKVEQTGNVLVEDRVEIGANTTIDRATLGSTIIRRGVKLDNLVQVAHNVEIGENTVIAAQSGIAGSTKIGSNCMVGGQVGFAGHLTIADGCKFQAQTGVAQSIKIANTAWGGTPAIDYRQFVKSSILVKQLPDLVVQIRELIKK